LSVPKESIQTFAVFITIDSAARKLSAVDTERLVALGLDPATDGQLATFLTAADAHVIQVMRLDAKAFAEAKRRRGVQA
jgi:hypothetical protein